MAVAYTTECLRDTGEKLFIISGVIDDDSTSKVYVYFNDSFKVSVSTFVCSSRIPFNQMRPVAFVSLANYTKILYRAIDAINNEIGELKQVKPEPCFGSPPNIKIEHKNAKLMQSIKIRIDRKEKTLKLIKQDILECQRKAAKTIETVMYDTISNPHTQFGKKRLSREFEQMQNYF